METPPRVVVGQGGSPSTPASGATYESPATLLSSARVKVIDLLCAGEIGGLVNGAKSIYLDDTPVENPNGTVNFTGFNYTLNVGTPTQAPLLGFDEVETHEDVGVKITNSLAAGVTRTVTDPDADACKVILQANSFYWRNKEGSIYGTSVRYRIYVSANGGPFVEVALQNMNGCAYSPYQRQVLITLKDKGSGPWQIRVTRTTPDRDPVNYADEIYFHSLTTVKYLKMRYPGCAVLGFEIDAKQFASIPQRSYDCYLQLVKVPTNYDPVTRVYATTGPGTTGGIWDGSFKVAWTDNPAWCWYDLLTNTTHGLGEYLDSLYIDKFTLYTIGQYCDQLVPDGYGGTEPRFRCNLLLQSREEAMKVVANMGSIFRAMIYWHAGMLIPVQDRPRDPVKNFTNANVVEGKFTYMGTPRKSRHTVALVRWNDPDDLYRVKVEYVEDMDGIRELGVREVETTAFGCTSRGQAHRHGKWALFSEVNETEFVDFVTGAEGSYVRPGEVINVFDRDKAGDRYGGRLVSNTTTSCVIDSPVTIQAGKTHTLYLTLSDGTVVTRTLTNAAASNVTTLTWSSALPSTVVANGVWGLAIVGVVEPQQFLVLAVTEEEGGTFHVSGKEYISGKFDFIENDIKFEPRPTSTLPNPKDGVAAPTNLNVAKTFSVVDGVFRRELLVSWTHSTHAYLRNYVISYRLDNDNWVTAGTTTSPMFQFRAPRPGVYAIRVETVSMIGLHSLPAEITYSLDDSVIKTSRITGLELKDQGNDTTFEGEDIRLVWRHNSADTATELADLASGERHPLLRGYLVEIFSDEAMLKRVKESEVLTPAFLYSYDENFRDSFGAPRRTLTFRVRAVDNYGQYSQATSITVYNPAPLIGDNPPTVDTSEISYQGVSGRIAVQLANVDDNDYQGMLIFASRNPAFALTDVRAAVGSEPKPEAMVPYAFDRSTGIDAGMLLYNGTNTQVSLEVIDNSVYYVIFAFYDGFGMEGINYYGPVAINVPVLAAGAPAPVVKINATAYTFAHNKSGAITPASATLTASTVNITVTSYQWQWWNGSAWADIVGQTSASLTRTSADVNAQVVTYRCLVNGTYADSVSLGHTYDGADELLAMLDNEAHTVSCDSTGTPFAGELGGSGTAKSNVRVYRGSGLLTPVVGTPAAWQYSLSLVGTNCSASVVGTGGGMIQLDSVSADSGYVTATINVENLYTLTKVFSWAKAKAGANGTRTGILDMYQWATVAPVAFPSGSITYTWATGQFTAPSTLNGWSLTPPAAVAGQTLWITRAVVTDATTSATTTIAPSWTTATATGAAGTSGSNGQRVGFLEMYQWSAAAPLTYPSGTSTYTWATGAFTAPGTLNGWALVPGAAVAGKTLWGISVIVSNTNTTATDSVTWNSTTVYPVGYAGSDGTNGQNATSYWLANAASAIQKSIAGVYTPTALAVSSFSQTGAGGPAPYAGRFIIATTPDGTTYTNQYTSASDQSTYSYTVPASIKAIRVRLYQAGGTSVLLDEEIVPIVSDGSNGASAVSSVLSNAAHTVAADAAGTVASWAGVTSTMTVYNGASDDSANWAFSAAPTNCTISTSGSPANRTVTLTGMSADSAYVIITATRSGYPTQTQQFNVSKAKQGIQGGTGATGATGGSGNVQFNSDFSLPTSGGDRPFSFTSYNNAAISSSYVYGASPAISGKHFGLRASASGATHFGIYSALSSEGPGVLPGWQPNKTYVVSVYARKVNAAAWTGVQLQWNAAPANTVVIANPTLSTSWQRYAWKLTMGGVVEAEGRLYIDRIGSGSANGDEIHFSNLQVEEGEVLTAWRGRSDASPGANFQGAYAGANTYFCNEVRKDIVTSGGVYYVTNNPTKSGTATWSTPGANTDWIPLGATFASFATGLLLTVDATITKTLTMGDGTANYGIIRSYGAASISSGSGYWLNPCNSSGVSEFRVGDPAGNNISFDGANLDVTARMFKHGLFRTETATSGPLFGWTESLWGRRDSYTPQWNIAIRSSGHPGYNSYLANFFQEEDYGRLVINQGKINFGPGSADTDTTLYRSAANTLKTDGSLYVGDASSYATSGVSGSLFLGSASLNSAIVVKRNSYAEVAMVASSHGQIGTKTNHQLDLIVNNAQALAISTGGALLFGASEDVNLYRSAADTLKTDDVFWAAGNRLLVSGSGYAANQSGIVIGQYSSACGYVQAPTGGYVDIWTSGTAAIARFNNDKSTQLYGSLTVGDGSQGTNFVHKKFHANYAAQILPAAANISGSGEAGLYWWVSEPWKSWTGAGIGRNCYNDSASFNQVNSGISSQMIRFDESDEIQFHTRSAGGEWNNPLNLRNMGAVLNGTPRVGASTLGQIRNINFSTSDPSGGADGDVWIKYT